MPAGDTNLFFSRDTKVYAVQNTAVGSTTFNVWELPVLNGYSFSQATNSSQVTVNEMSDITNRSRRAQQAFNDSLAPAEWSFDTYARPSLVSVVRAPEEILWHSLLSESILTTNAITTTGISVASWIYTGTTITLTVAAHPFRVGDNITVSGLTATTNAPNGNALITGTTTTTITFTAAAAPTGTAGVTSAKIVSTSASSTNAALDFFATNSNKTRLATFDLYFVLGATKAASPHVFADNEATTIYRIRDCCVNEATMNFDIDGIATISWSGMGAAISEVASITLNSGNYTLLTSSTITGTTDNGLAMVSGTGNMIRNRLTALSIVGTNPGVNSGNAKTYNITLTGGSITISNNMTFLTPETIGIVNVPLGHVTGTRSVTGNFTAYLDELTGSTIDLYQDLLTITGVVTNKFALKFFVGGRADDNNPIGPGVMYEMGLCHLEIPTVNIDDVIGMEVNFTALPSTVGNTNELNRIRYVAAT
jgi:hypothetical protein